MHSTQPVSVDVLISPFDASAAQVVALAREAEAIGFGGVWTYDHMTGAIFDRKNSQDVFTMLGAIAASTERVEIGPLVVNMVNRHPVRLALAMSTLQELTGGRAILGLGGGASPTSRFSTEQRALGVTLHDAPTRAAMLIETLEVLRTLWGSTDAFSGQFFEVGMDFSLQTATPPRVIIGASGPSTARIALEHADGMNVASPAAFSPLEDLIRDQRPAGFEVSVHVPIDIDAPLESQLPQPSSEVDRWILAVPAQASLDALTQIHSGMRALHNRST